jgi:hypothetical protein
MSCQQTKDSIIETALKKEAAKFNKTGGKMIDDETRMDSVAVTKGKVVNYYYTLIKDLKGDLDTTALKKAMRPQIKKTLSTNEELKIARKNKVSFKYHYYDKNGEYAFRMGFIAKDYIAK